MRHPQKCTHPAAAWAAACTPAGRMGGWQGWAWAGTCSSGTAWSPARSTLRPPVPASTTVRWRGPAVV
eukprot:scaffold279630_cov19-Tisochrysis_lutea.AAC.1